MSIASEITRLQGAKTDLKTSINAKTDSSHQITNETIDAYASFVDSIPTGGLPNRLPNEYQEVEYIESSGTQYFNTGYYANGYSCFDFKFSNGITSGVIFGAYNTAWTTGIGFYHNNTTSQREYFHYYANTMTSLEGSYLKEYDLISKRGYLYSDGVAVASTSDKTFSINYPLYILAGNWAGSRAEQPVSCKLYYFKISERELVLHEYIPCYRKIDGVIGLYDLTQNEFLTNAGTGDFTKGADHDTPLINLQEKSVNITTNTTTEITPDSGYNGLSKVNVTTNISGGGNVYADPTITTYNYVGGLRSLITSIDNIDTSTLTNFNAMFQGCNNLVTMPSLDLSNCTNMKSCFASCDKLENLPAFNIPKVTNMQNCFQYTENLSNDSINNILATCITATSYTRTKSLSELGISSTKYPSSMIQGLSNYQAFINAGWTIGY